MDVPEISENKIFVTIACEDGDLNMLRLILRDTSIDLNMRNYALRYASKKGRLKLVKEVLKDGRVTPASKNYSVIRKALQLGHIKIVGELLYFLLKKAHVIEFQLLIEYLRVGRYDLEFPDATMFETHELLSTFFYPTILGVSFLKRFCANFSP